MQASFWTLWNRLYTIDGRSIAAGPHTTAIEMLVEMIPAL